MLVVLGFHVASGEEMAGVFEFLDGGLEFLDGVSDCCVVFQFFFDINAEEF